MKKKILGVIFFMLLMAGHGALTGLVFAGERTGKTAEEGLALLKEGNARFVAMKMEHPDESAARREETAAKGQKPFAIVLGCADSRVPAETIFDRGIGDIFVIRVAGNIAMDSSVIGSLEYAAGHLQVPLIVVLGHTQCGAVGAAVSGAELEGRVREIQKKIEPVAEEVKKEHPGLRDPALTTEVAKRNVFQVEQDLLVESSEIRERVAKKELKIVPALYDVKTGKVDWIEGK